MKICNVLNEANGEKSELHAELLRIFKDQKQADLYYSKVLGKDFKKLFGDWAGNYKGTSKEKTGPTLPKGEPELFNKKGTRQYYFKLLDGTKLFVDRKGLRKSFSPTQINDISKYFLFRFVSEGGSKSFNEYDAAANQSKILDSIDKAIADYKTQVNSIKNEKAKAEFTRRIEKIELFKDDWKNELVYQLDSLGQKFHEKITDSEGNPVAEVTEEGKSSGLNMKESITVNPKTTATVNTKIFLSQLTSKVKNKEGKLVSKKSGYLKTPVFEDFSKVWETLQPMLADKVTSGSNADVVSAYKLMRESIEALRNVKPWASDLANKLDTMYNGNNNSRYKVYEFVQAFNKNKLDYNVTEFNKAAGKYTVINATATNSRESQILLKWGYRFQQKWLPNGQIYLSNEKAAEIDGIETKIGEVYDSWKEEIGLAGKDQSLISDAYTKHIPALFKQLKELGAFGLENKDINAYILEAGGTDYQVKSTDDLFRSVRFMINKTVTMPEHKFVDDNGDFLNPFKTESGMKDLARAAAYRELDIAESTVLGPDGNTYFTYSNPTYINNKINEWKKDPSSLEELAALSINGNSQWIRYLLASDLEHNEKLQEKESQRRLDKLKSSIASSFTSAGKNDGVNNVQISLQDQINDNIAKMLGDRLNKNTSIFPSIIAADKSRRIEFKGLPMIKSGINNRGAGEKMYIPPQTVDMFVDYFLDEYNRMRDVADELKTTPDSKKVHHYHTGKKNGLKSQIFPEFNHDNTNEANGLKALRVALYQKDGTPLESDGVREFDSNQLKLVTDAVRRSLIERLNDTYKELAKLESETKIDQSLLKSYKVDGGLAALAGDYLVNGLVSSIEYTKLFSGDPAYFKDMPDLIKRIPATYTDGLQLALESGDDMKFNAAIVEGVNVASQYQKIIYDSLKDKNIAKAYGRYKDGSGSNVNTTDAQAWITPRRWRFIKQRLGQWTPLHDAVFSKMESGKTLDDHELKLAAQPLKGVYFEINNGVPTYLKYSQAVLIPAMVKSTPMERLLYKMTHDKDGNELSAADETHEVITIDGIKVGALAPTKINEGDTTKLAESFELNTNTLNNKGWKLQQDLPIKSMHETNIGTQIQKNILEGLMLDQDYLVGGAETKGQVLLQKIHDAVSELVNIGKEEVDAKLGITNKKITDTSALYDVIIDEFRSRGGNENIIAALEKETPFDAIPQIAGRIDSILMSVFNRAMTKISTEGGSYIQVSPFGYETVGEGSNIKIVSDRYNKEGLLPPRKGEDGQTLPGQIMIPHTLALDLLNKAGLKADKLNEAEWLELFKDPKVRELVGYRIPNQGMSSNDTLEIVGILPATMGDSIIGYDGIPAKTGSDFDIDKMYIMAPNLMYNKKAKSFEVISEENKQFYKGKKSVKKLIAQNKVLSLYSDVLQSPHTYDNMMTSIDSEFLKKDILKLYPEKPYKNLDLFSPITQLKTKMNYMSGKMGVALTANQLVDHVANQSLNITVKANLGLAGEGNIVVAKKKGFTKMDRSSKGRSIATTLSAYLNAYVDIAKDPYVTRGNHNDVTANVVFMLIRAGASMEDVNRYIGQPILIEYVELIKREESLTAEPITIKDKDGVVKKATPYEYLRNKYNIKEFDKSHIQLAKISKTDLENRIKGQENNFIDSVVLNAFEFHEKKAAQWTDAVLAAKSDVKGAGGSPVNLLINQNKIDKVIKTGFVIGYESKFADTALGTYKKEALDYVSDVLERSEILLSGTRGARSLMNSASSQITKDDYLISEKLGKAVMRGAYTYLMSGTPMMKNNRRNFEFLFKKLPAQLDAMKVAGDKNFLVNELEIQYRGGYSFIGINSKNKPSQYQNEIYRAWMELYENPETKDFAVNLVRYSFSQSGFQMNLNQFFTHIPHEILKSEGINKDVDGFFGKIDVMDVDNIFLDQLYRHEADNSEVVPVINRNQFVVLKDTDTAYGFVPTEKFLEPYSEVIHDVPFYYPPKFLTTNLGDGVTGLYELVEREGVIAYKRTHKLGYKAGKNRVFEYNYDTKVEKSILDQNELDKDMINGIQTVLIANIEANKDERYSNPTTVAEDFSSAEAFKEKTEAVTGDEEFSSFKLTLDIMKSEGITKKDC